MVFIVFTDVECAFTSYKWCSDCQNIMNAYKTLFTDSSNMLVIRHGDLYNPKCSFVIKANGITEPINPGVYPFLDPVSFSIDVTNVDPSYHLTYWLIDGTLKEYTPPTYTSGRHTIAAYFTPNVSPGYGGPGRNAIEE
jgi:hypothetical protein